MQFPQASKDDSENIVQLYVRSWQRIYRGMFKDEYFNVLMEKSS